MISLLVPADDSLHKPQVGISLFGYPLALPGDLESLLSLACQQAHCARNEPTSLLCAHDVLGKAHSAVFVRFLEIFRDVVGREGNVEVAVLRLRLQGRFWSALKSGINGFNINALLAQPGSSLFDLV